MKPLFDGVCSALVGEAREVEPGAYAAEFRFAEDFIGFAGHFPENPVVPGIALIMAVQVTAGLAAAGGNVYSEASAPGLPETSTAHENVGHEDAAHCAALCAGLAQEARLLSIKRCKFSRPVRPGEVVTVTARLSAPSVAKRKVAALLTVGGEACAEMTLFLGMPCPQGGAL